MRSVVSPGPGRGTARPSGRAPRTGGPPAPGGDPDQRHEQRDERSRTTRISPARQSTQPMRASTAPRDDGGADERGKRSARRSRPGLQARAGRRSPAGPALPAPRPARAADRREHGRPQPGTHPRRAAGSDPLLHAGHRRTGGADRGQRDEPPRRRHAARPVKIVTHRVASTPAWAIVSTAATSCRPAQRRPSSVRQAGACRTRRGSTGRLTASVRLVESGLGRRLPGPLGQRRRPVA